MTMASVAVTQGSPGNPSAMLTPKRYHLQSGTGTGSPSPTASPTPGKNYDTLSKGKKSWSVRLGLSRQSQMQSEEGPKQGWGTISGGSALSRQMRYGDPWLYGTVRGSRQMVSDPRLGGSGFGGRPILVVCSCPEFLSGTTRRLGNCKKCGGHRVAGLPLGGTCRAPSAASRLRPSLAGVLRPALDDPYDLVRRSRLVEPRTRARSISPHRQGPRDGGRSQSVAWSAKEQDHWFNSEGNDSGFLQRKGWRKREGQWLQDEGGARDADSRRSILECDVNPYLLVKKQATRDEDEFSDDLSDNALELDEPQPTLFDPSKVKSIERIPARCSVAAIGGQRIRVFNEPREPSDEDEQVGDHSVTPTTGIPIPKVSPKRPPRRSRTAEAKAAPVKGILKRLRAGRPPGAKKKSVLFSVNNVVFAPAKLEFGKHSEEPEDDIEENIVSEEKVEKRPKFITIPNIRDPKSTDKVSSARKSATPPRISGIPKSIARTETVVRPATPPLPVCESVAASMNEPKTGSGKVRLEDETELEIEIEELKEQPTENDEEERHVETTETTETNDTTATRRPALQRSQSERTPTKPGMVENVQFSDTMRLSIRRRIQRDAETAGSQDSPPQLADESDPTRTLVPLPVEEAEDETEPNLPENLPTHRDAEPELPPRSNWEGFQRMRPTSWSPPPSKHKTLPQNRSSDPGTTDFKPPKPSIAADIKASFNSKVGVASSRSENVFKITVSPLQSPLVHRLQIGSEAPSRGGRRTSIMINGDQNSSGETSSNNKVTISVGGEDSVCNPTVISVNTDVSPKIQSSSENRTLVILDNYSSNIIVKPCASRADVDEDCERDSTEKRGDQAKPSVPEEGAEGKRVPSLSKEAMVSKLLEDSLKKARRNGEILDETSGEAILKILKETLLKSGDYESSESTVEPDQTYSRSSSLNSEVDFVAANMYIEENPYEVIKEPIYEEIPDDQPPPLPLSPPPSEVFQKEQMYFGEEYKEASYYKKFNSGQLLRSYFPDDFFKKPTAEELSSKIYHPSEPFAKKPSSSPEENYASKFELLNYLIDSKERTGLVEEEEDAEGELDALYEQKETSLDDLSSKSSQISNVSDSSEDGNLPLATSSSPETLKMRTVDIERTDSGVGSESSQASSSRGAVRRWRGSSGRSSGPGSLLGVMPQVVSGDAKLCQDCEQRLDPLVTISGVVYAPFVCRKCAKKRSERKEIVMEIVETEQKYGRDLQIILEEFYRPMLRAGLLTQDQLSAIFLNVEELLEHNVTLAEKLREAVEIVQESGDEDLVTMDVGKIFLESEGMLHAFESYCTRQGSASLLLQNLEKEKELLRIFLKVSQMENAVLRRMNLNSFLMVPVQRVTKYPLLLARLYKATPSNRPDIQTARNKLKQAQTNIELHLEHMNAEAKDVTSTKLWRRISIIQNGRRSIGEQDMVNIKLRKMAVEVLEWAHEEVRFALEGRLLVALPTDNNWRRGKTVKLVPVTAMLVTNGKPNTQFLDLTDDSLFPRQIGIKEATLLLVKEKIGRYSLLREPLYLDKCIVCCEADLEDYFEIQELSSKETFIFKAEDGVRTKRWCRTLQAHAQSLGAWRRRRGALANIMICGVDRN
ncbi:uncharacterized protein LOC124303458 isoform X1 [Neodiprion virginianus]|uniref:uncharacterized protein LOC124303458 isoform X1 n=1 Tax=Neodiprion virginianus TaxID=2961670 RepID=UPI001EE716DD|nr:uncharacterized protein LOC124303458 isoform X1 [Neodiprion virginianus]